MTDQEINELLASLDEQAHDQADVLDRHAARCIRELRARRDELQLVVDQIALGR